MRVLIIIPAYNEQESILGFLSELTAEYPDYDYVVINDCSTDDTAAILAQNGCRYVSLPANLGIGGGVQTGYLYAVQNDYDIAVQMDGDGQHDPAYLREVVDPVARGDVDMCIGSRFLEKEGFQTSSMRRFGINFLSGLIRVFCGRRVHDVTSGFRATNKELSAFFSENYAQDYPEPEAIVAAVTAGFRVGEVPVRMRERQGGVSSIASFRSIYYMIKVSIAIVLGRFATGRRKSRD